MNFPIALALPCVLLLFGFFQVDQTESARILSVSFFSSKSHKITWEPLLRELARRGHEVTILSPLPAKDEKNFKTLTLLDLEEEFKHSGLNFFEMKLQMPAWVEVFMNPYLMLGGFMKDVCTKSYALPAVQQVLKEKWDLIFFTPLFNECIYGMVYKLNTTTILYTQTAAFSWITGNLGTPSPLSFVSTPLLGLDERMTFPQRFLNIVKNTYDWAIQNLYFYPKTEALYRELLNDPTIPSITEIEKNVSIVLSNSQISFNPPRPLLPDIVEVGGMHMLPAKTVEPKELNDFLNGAKHGFILFSMGSALKGSDMPENYRKMFLNVFSKLKQRVLWKWETEKMDDLPPNVRLSKWIPQQDVLGHKNLKAFITHGGHGSTTESIYHGVPLIGIPMLGDQPSNMRKAARKGFALPPLEFAELTEEILLKSINEVLTNPTYQETAKKLQSIYHDQLSKPLDRGIYWVEYVLRHKGAVHMRSAARDLGHLQYFSIDVIAVLLVITLIAIKINMLIVKALVRKCCGSKDKSKNKDSKKTNKKNQ